MAGARALSHPVALQFRERQDPQTPARRFDRAKREGPMDANLRLDPEKTHLEP